MTLFENMSILDYKTLIFRRKEMNEKTIFDAIRETVAERTDANIDDIKMESTFHELGIDSLDTVELLMNLEDKLGVTIEVDKKLETVKDLVDFIAAL